MARRANRQTLMSQIYGMANPRHALNYGVDEHAVYGEREDESPAPRLRRSPEEDYSYTDPEGNVHARRGGVSSFSNVGALNRGRDGSHMVGPNAGNGFAADGEERSISTYAGPRSASQRALMEYGSLIQKGRQQKRAVQASKDNALASMLYYARQNGGYVPPEMMDSVNMSLGQQLVGGNFSKNGNFVLYGKQAVNGREQITPVAVVSPEQQFGALQRTGIDLPAQRKIYGNLSQRYTAEQLAGAGLAEPNAYYDKMLMQQDKANTEVTMQLLGNAIKQYGSQFRQYDPSDLVERLMGNKNIVDALTRGKMRTEVDRDGREVPVKDDMGNPVYETVSMSDALAGLMKKTMAERDKAIAAGRESGAIKSMDALMKEYTKAYLVVKNGLNENSQRTLGGGSVPADGMREDMEADPPLRFQPQEYIKYRDRNGRIVAANGYIREGRVYDSTGSEVPGAEALFTTGPDSKAWYRRGKNGELLSVQSQDSVDYGEARKARINGMKGADPNAMRIAETALDGEGDEGKDKSPTPATEKEQPVERTAAETGDKAYEEKINRLIAEVDALDGVYRPLTVKESAPAREVSAPVLGDAAPVVRKSKDDGRLYPADEAVARAVAAIRRERDRAAPDTDAKLQRRTAAETGTEKDIAEIEAALKSVSVEPATTEKDIAEIEAALKSVSIEPATTKAKREAKKKPEAKKSAAMPKMRDETTMLMPDGTVLKPGSRWTDRETGKVYVWRGGNARNFTIIAR